MASLFARMRDVSPEEAARRADRSRVGDWLWYGSLSVLLLFVSIGALSAAAAVSPAFCTACHSVAAAKLEQSPHATLACDSCHRRHGALGLVENRLWVAGMVLESPIRTVFPSGAKASIDSRMCVDCHSDQMAVTSVRNGIRMNHEALVEDDWSCERCHRSVGHGEGGVSAAVYTMGTCMECHSPNPGSVSDCARCHPEGIRPSAARALPSTFRVTHGENWQKTHGMGDLPTCSVCHARDYCVRCHRLPLPHAANYLSVHGDAVAKLGADACTTCHAAESCDACHGGVPMPHPEGFLESHKGEVELSGKASCERCHASSSCETCHARHTHPGLSPERVKELRDRPVKPR